MDQTLEQWCPVVGYEGLYEVSDHGRVKGPKGFIKPKPTQNGYVRTELWRKSQRYRPLLHRLVASHFIDNPHNKPVVNHLDGNRTNNVVSNLEWATHSENIIHSVVSRQAFGENAASSKLTNDEVIAIKVMLSKGMPGTVLAKLFGVTPALISAIKVGKNRVRG